MKKYTFEELVRNDSVTFEPYDNTRFLDIKDVLDLLKQVRQATLQEAFNKTKLKTKTESWGEFETSYIIDKNSILDLDKDSIEVDE